MWIAFTSCLALAVGGPLLTRWYILNATFPLQVLIQPRAGIVGVQEKGRGDVALIGESREIPPQSRIILSSDDAEAFLLFYLPSQPEAPVCAVQLYGQTDLAFAVAETPRFERYSILPHHISIQVTTSRDVRATVGGEGERATRLLVEIPQTELVLEDGAYTLSVDSLRAEIAVRQGLARIPDGEAGVLMLEDSQRAEITTEGIENIFTGGQRNIVRNGDFDQDIDTHWATYSLAKERADQSDGSIVRSSGERKTVKFERIGVGHIEIGITQRLNQDVSGIQALYLTALVKVDSQSIPVCGANGTECPIMLRLTYLDQQGGAHEWLQGFYAQSGGDYTDICPISICESRPQHIQAPQGAWFAYSSPDLIALLRERDIEPAVIQAIDIYASGHSFVAEVDEISLLIED